jgi:hypothetical protein
MFARKLNINPANNKWGKTAFDKNIVAINFNVGS